MKGQLEAETCGLLMGTERVLWLQKNGTAMDNIGLHKNVTTVDIRLSKMAQWLILG